MVRWQRILTPSKLLVLSFAALIVLGSLALLLPGTTVLARGASFSDALFTATSAVCVTGLVVRDTGRDFTLFGQVIILLLIQVGGLGILTFSNLLLLLRRGKIDLSRRMLLQESFGMLPTVTPRELIRSVVGYTLIVEGVGAVVLALRFIFTYHMEAGQALWAGVFHSVSAFCNAGFSLFSDSLISYRDDWVINLTIIVLIILGGLGFVVAADIKQWLAGQRRRRRVRISLHSKVVLVTSLVLVAAGTLLFFVLELTDDAMPVSFVSHLWQSLFLSVTARTAGFNSVDIASLTNASLLILMLLMLVGGSPGSTAGGMKTTSIAAMAALLRSRIRNRAKVEMFNRSLPPETVTKALTTVAAFLGVVIVAVIMLQVSELFGVPHCQHRGQFLEYLFEVVSALCTVGLSTGITATLSEPGRLIIVMCMFLGRLGPVLIASSVIGTRQRLEYSYAEEDIIVG